jgi:hypothetical protein
MSSKNMKIAGAAFAGLLLIAAATAADLLRPNIKLGLWEITASPQGGMPTADEMLARLPPEQRAAMAAAMQAHAGMAAQPRAYKECMTPEKVARGFKAAEDTDTTCQRNVISSSASEMRIHMDCTKPQGNIATDMHFQMTGGDRMSGTLDIVRTMGGHSMKINIVMSGKWLGADCGNIK